MEPKIGLALGGGAARGLAHLGVLKVFEEASIPINIIAGTSLGALMGGLYASQPDASLWMGKMDQFLRSFRSRKTRLEFLRKMEQPANNHGFFSDMASMMRKGYFWGVTATKSAFIGEQEYEDLIYPLIPDIAIEETKIPFGCTATDIRFGKRVTYTAGRMRTAVSASCSLPGIFPPVRDRGMLLIDGGWVERVPVMCAREMGADIVIAVDVSSEAATFEDKSGLDIVLRADAVSRIFLNEIVLQQADVVVHPDVSATHWADFSDPLSLFRAGERAALEKLIPIRTAIQRAAMPQKRLVEQIKSIKDKIVEKMTGTK
ncbi:MAG TPA: patatin-like phospholipase family protein [Dissulfurispiraceae bacterium]|nr:patatin-like phospholipase family protein [Dissulfurispiraceae bacterium]